jgi:hypothetical protein
MDWDWVEPEMLAVKLMQFLVTFRRTCLKLYLIKYHVCLLLKINVVGNFYLEFLLLLDMLADEPGTQAWRQSFCFGWARDEPLRFWGSHILLLTFYEMC